jgi:hypothetical protein
MFYDAFKDVITKPKHPKKLKLFTQNSSTIMSSWNHNLINFMEL